MIGVNTPPFGLLSLEIIIKIGLFSDFVVSLIMHAVSGHEIYDRKTYDVFSRPKSHVNFWTFFVVFVCN